MIFSSYQPRITYNDFPNFTDFSRNIEDLFRKCLLLTPLFTFQVGHSIAKYGDRNIKWVSHGMLRIDVDVMRKLFEKPLDKICQVGISIPQTYFGVCIWLELRCHIPSNQKNF